ncbi:MAG TPA: hypothetical protein VHA53_09270, partial [Nitrolancea sp.]|nr:hypothetical protein [Nitrolancea sp.]
MSRPPNNQIADPAVIWRKMFALEARKGYLDTAVSGGFERYFAGQPTTAADGAVPELRKLFTGYARLDAGQREQRIEQAQALLRTGATPRGAPAVEVPHTPTQKKPSPRRAAPLP